MSEPRMSLPAAHHETAATMLERLSVDPASGLSSREAEARLRDSGPNQLKARARTPAWRLLLRQLANLSAAQPVKGHARDVNIVAEILKMTPVFQ